MEENTLVNEPLSDLPENPEAEIEPVKLAGYSLSLEGALYLLAVLVALVLRLAVLGRLPLSENEAAYAWQAYQVSQGEPLTLLSHPAYILLTGGLFRLFGSGEVMARLLPALVGSAVVAFPFVFRRQLGPRAAVVAAFGLAIDPLLVAYSRQAGSPAMALGFAALALLLWQERTLLLAGVFAGLALLSGPSAVLGLLTILVGGLGVYLVNQRKQPVILSEVFGEMRFLAGAGLALLLVGTALLRYPQGLASMFQAAPDYFETWFAALLGGSSSPLLRSLVGLAVYSPVALLLGVIAVSNLDVWLDEDSRPFAFWLLAALVFALVNPGRQISDLLWVIVPLWLLAAPMVGKFMRRPNPADREMVWLGAIFVLVLMLYWRLNLDAMTRQTYVNFPPEFNLFNFGILDQNTKLYLVRLIITFFIPILIGLLVIVVQISWSGGLAFQATTWGMGAFLVIYLVSVSFGFSDDRTKIAGELWTGGSTPGYIEEIQQTVREAGKMSSVVSKEVDLVYMIDSPQLHWMFRDFPNADYMTVLESDKLPSIVLNTDPTYGYMDKGQFYRGQLAVLNYHQAWGGASLPQDVDRWLVYRDSPLEKEWLAIWTRADLFPLYSPPLIEPEPLPDAAE